MAYHPSQQRLFNELGISLVEIPEGEFLMGAAPHDEQASPYEKPEHTVYLDLYRIANIPVTNKAFEKFVLHSEYKTTAERLQVQGAACKGDILTWRDFAGGKREQHQVVCVTWEDAKAFCDWVALETQRRITLPTEAQWEKAARGKLTRALYPWGDENPEGKTCWNRASIQPIGTLPVQTFPDYGYGLYGMAGNVWEWCTDWYGEDYYWQSLKNNPIGPSFGRYRVRRGGAWNVEQQFRLRCSNRGAMPPECFWPNMGFRVVEEIYERER